MKRLTSLFATAARLSLVLMAAPLLRADVYEDLRAKWVDGVTGGNYTIDAALTTKIDAADALVAQLRSEMVAGVPPANGYLFPEANLVAASLGESQVHAHITKSFENLAKMAIALRTKGSDYEFIGTGSALAIATRDDVKRGLDWMYNYAYQNNTIQATPNNPNHNWWDLEIGSTGWLGTILCSLSTGPFLTGANGGLTQTVINTYSRPMILKLRNPTLLNGSGANGAWRARTWTYLGMLRKNLDENLVSKNYLSECQARLDGVLASPPPDVYTFNSEGFHPDGMFIGHIFHPYTGGYGAQMIDRLIELDEFYTGTAWQTSGVLKASMLAWITSSDLQTYHLQFFQNVRGRGLTRYSLTNATATGLCLTTIWVSESALSADQQWLRSLVKNWLVSTPSVNLLTDPGLTIPQYLRAKRYYDLYYTAAIPLPTNDTYKQYPYGSTAVVLRPGYAASVNMFTADNVGQTRPQIKTNEVIHDETPAGAFLSNGALQVLTSDTDAFANGYYENLDWQRIPGTTIDRDLLPAGDRYENNTNWAGGVGVGRFGVTGFELEPKAGTSATALGKFHARKAWFFFDKEIVALGADIRRTDTTVTHKIHTNVENRKIRADNANAFKIDSLTSLAAIGGTSTTLSSTDIVFTGARRAWVSGNTSGTDMGYYFPNPTEITYRRQQRDTVAPAPPPVPYVDSAKFLLMWINHGVPSAGGYQYVLLPNQTEAQTIAYANNPEVTVLENSAGAQAVRKVMPAPTVIEQDETLDVTGALVLNDTNTAINLPASQGGTMHVRSSRQGALMVEETEETIKISFADVTWAQTGSTTVEVAKQVSGWQSKASSSTVLSTYPTIRLDVPVAGAKGAGQEFLFYKRHEFSYENNGLPLVASSGDTPVPYLTGQTGADGGRIFSYNADAIGDYATFKIWHQMAGSYKAVIRFKKSTNRGKVKIYLGTTSTPTTQIGSEIDLYNASDLFQTVEIPIAAFAVDGDRFIKFEVSGKNASSGGYRVVLDSLEFKPL
jgi:hyaluronate lyase